MRRAWSVVAAVGVVAAVAWAAREIFDVRPSAQGKQAARGELPDRTADTRAVPTLVAPARSPTAPARAEDPDTVQEAVLVQDLEGRPISGARIWASGREVGVTGADGVATVARPIASESFEASAPGFRLGWSTKRRLGATPWVIELMRGAVLLGRVLEEGTGKPVPGARVRATEHGAADGNGRVRDIPEATSDAAGRFRLDTLGDRDERLWVEARGWSRARANIRITDDGRVEPAEVVLEVRPAGWLSATVTTPDGSPAEGAVLVVRPEGLGAPSPAVYTFTPYLGPSYSFDQGILLATVDERGFALVPGLPFGTRFTVSVLHASGADVAPPASVVATAEAPGITFERRLRPTATLRVHATGTDTSAEHWLSIEIDGQDGDHSAWSARGSATVTAAGIVAGRRTVEVRATRRTPITFEAEFREGETVERTLAFEAPAPGLELSGEVVDVHGAGLEGVTVWVVTAGTKEGAGWGRTDARGAFHVDRLAAGAYDLKVVDRSWGMPWLPQVVSDVRPPRQDLRIVLKKLPEVVARFVPPPGMTPPRGFDRFGSASSDGYVAGSTVRWVLDEEAARVGVKATGWALWERDVQVRAGEVLDLGEIVLDPGHEIQGSVVDTNGHAVGGARVRVDHLHGPDATSGRDGSFGLRHVPSSGAWVVVTADGFLREELAVPAARLKEPLRIALRRGGSLRIRVVNANGGPGAGYAVDVDPDAERTHANTASGQTDADGHTATRLPAGRYTVRVRQAAYGDEEPVLAEAQVTLVEGGDHPIELRLP